MCYNETVLRFWQINHSNSLRFIIWEVEVMRNFENSIENDRASNCGSERLKNCWIDSVKHKCLIKADSLARSKFILRRCC